MAMRLNAARRAALPYLVLMTDDERLPDPLAAVAALPKGAMVIVRSRDPVRRATLARDILTLSRTRHGFVLIADDPALAVRLDADGVHLPERRAREASHWRALHPAWLIGSALHTWRPPPVQCDFAILSPVFPTRSHPDRGALGAARAAALARSLPLPVYALGGIDDRNARRLSGFAGIAAIGALAA